MASGNQQWKKEEEGRFFLLYSHRHLQEHTLLAPYSFLPSGLSAQEKEALMTEIGSHRDWQVFKMDSFSGGFFHRLFVSMLHASPVCVCSRMRPLHSTCCVSQQRWLLSVWPAADTERKLQGKGEARVLLISLCLRQPLRQQLCFLSSPAPTEEPHSDPSFFPGVLGHRLQ